jgi:hypothetical protein
MTPNSEPLVTIVARGFLMSNIRHYLGKSNEGTRLKVQGTSDDSDNLSVRKPPLNPLLRRDFILR